MEEVSRAVGGGLPPRSIAKDGSSRPVLSPIPIPDGRMTSKEIIMNSLGIRRGSRNGSCISELSLFYILICNVASLRNSQQLLG